MKDIRHFTNVTFMVLLIGSMAWGFTDKDIRAYAAIIVAVCWTTSMIIRNGIASLIALTAPDEEEKD
jgi:hypothetical protein